MTGNMASFKISIKNGVKAFLVMLIICSGLMFAIQQSETVKPLYSEIQSYNKQTGVHLQVLPNALDLMGLSLQIPFTIESQGDTKYPIKIDFDLHLLMLLIIPLVTVRFACAKSFKDGQPISQHLKEYVETAVVFAVLSQIALVLNTKRIYFDGLQHYGITLKGGFHHVTGIILTVLIIFLMQVFWRCLLKKEGCIIERERAVLEEVFIGLGAYLKLIVLVVFVQTIAFIIWLSGTMGVKWHIGLANLIAIPIGIVIMSMAVKAVSALFKPQFGLKIGILGVMITVINLILAWASRVRISVKSDLTILKLIPFLNGNGEYYMYIPLVEVLGLSVLIVGLAGAIVLVTQKFSVRK